jgi:hypothetical protein
MNSDTSKKSLKWEMEHVIQLSFGVNSTKAVISTEDKVRRQYEKWH